jgi:hypothetical protein
MEAPPGTLIRTVPPSGTEWRRGARRPSGRTRSRKGGRPRIVSRAASRGCDRGTDGGRARGTHIDPRHRDGPDPHCGTGCPSRWTRCLVARLPLTFGPAASVRQSGYAAPPGLLAVDMSAPSPPSHVAVNPRRTIGLSSSSGSGFDLAWMTESATGACDPQARARRRSRLSPHRGGETSCGSVVTVAAKLWYADSELTRVRSRRSAGSVPHPWDGWTATRVHPRGSQCSGGWAMSAFP